MRAMGRTPNGPDENLDHLSAVPDPRWSSENVSEMRQGTVDVPRLYTLPYAGQDDSVHEGEPCTTTADPSSVKAK